VWRKEEEENKGGREKGIEIEGRRAPIHFHGEI
jgi:hypothetical protein